MKAFKISATLFLALLVLGLTSCNSCSSNKQPAHTHEDGSAHHNHAEEPAKPAAQERFTMEADSTQKATPTTKDEKPADNGHDHSDPNHKH